MPNAAPCLISGRHAELVSAACWTVSSDNPRTDKNTRPLQSCDTTRKVAAEEEEAEESVEEKEEEEKEEEEEEEEEVGDVEEAEGR